MEHTKGKWVVEKDGTVFDVRTAEGQNIATVFDIEEADGELQTAANARLIAAAPSLLEACKAFIDCIGKDGYCPQAGKPITDNMRKAIALAEGK